ncbi:hypothetical protein H8356DRAFT_1362593 [Neocallimastix lanati (nom. inval.)]|nr:hypothetical protein H8356DRAFT_1362593 [Neocallimastix sp. JGI-2020a]
MPADSHCPITADKVADVSAYLHNCCVVEPVCYIRDFRGLRKKDNKYYKLNCDEIFCIENNVRTYVIDVCCVPPVDPKHLQHHCEHNNYTGHYKQLCPFQILYCPVMFAVKPKCAMLIKYLFELLKNSRGFPCFSVSGRVLQPINIVVATNKKDLLETSFVINDRPKYVATSVILSLCNFLMYASFSSDVLSLCNLRLALPSLPGPAAGPRHTDHARMPPAPPLALLWPPVALHLRVFQGYRITGNVCLYLTTKSSPSTTTNDNVHPQLSIPDKLSTSNQSRAVLSNVAYAWQSKVAESNRRWARQHGGSPHHRFLFSRCPPPDLPATDSSSAAAPRQISLPPTRQRLLEAIADTASPSPTGFASTSAGPSSSTTLPKPSLPATGVIHIGAPHPPPIPDPPPASLEGGRDPTGCGPATPAAHRAPAMPAAGHRVALTTGVRERDCEEEGKVIGDKTTMDWVEGGYSSGIDSSGFKISVQGVKHYNSMTYRPFRDTKNGHGYHHLLPPSLPGSTQQTKVTTNLDQRLKLSSSSRILVLEHLNTSKLNTKRKPQTLTLLKEAFAEVQTRRERRQFRHSSGTSPHSLPDFNTTKVSSTPLCFPPFIASNKGWNDGCGGQCTHNRHHHPMGWPGPPPSAIDLLQGGWHVGPYGDALWIRPFLVDFDYHVGPPIHVLAYDWLEDVNSLKITYMHIFTNTSGNN